MIGTNLGHFEIIGKLGEGGMGVVYKALDRRLEREVAIKLLSPDLAADVSRHRRFLAEAKAAAALNHPNIATIHSVEELDGEHFIVMEYIHGRALDSLLAQGPLPVETVLDIAEQAGSGLRAAHEKGIVHRDIKSANLMLTDDGLVKIMDFGLAKVEGRGGLTKTGTFVGTVAYSSPEQVSGRMIDHRTDIWSLGVVLYELLAGRRPFEGESPSAVIYSILSRDPRPLREVRSDVPVVLDEIVARALLKEPSARFTDINVFLQALGTSEGDAGSRTLERPLARPDEGTSIAVLPFVHLSADPEDQYFCDGLAEDLISALTEIPHLKVVARSTAFSFKGSPLSAEEIGRRLGVRSVLEGSMRKAGNRLRITARLSDVAEGYQIWSERYDRPLEDVFAVQDEISLTIAEKLELELLGSDHARVVKRYTEDIEAYNLYLKGRHFAYTKKGIEYFERALEHDPTYALAWAGLADTYSGLGVVALLPPQRSLALAREAAEKAIALDDSLAEAHTSLGLYKYWLAHDWPGAERELRRAIEIDASHAPAHCWLANQQCFAGKIDTALGEIEIAQALDPLSPMILALNSWVLYAARRFEDAVEQGRAALEIDPEHIVSHYLLALPYKEMGLYDEAISTARKAVELTRRGSFFVGLLGHLHALAGDESEALSLLDELEHRSAEEYVTPLANAWIYLALANREKAIAWFETALEEGIGPYHLFPADSVYDPIRTAPRFRVLLEKVGMGRWAVPPDELPTRER